MCPALSPTSGSTAGMPVSVFTRDEAPALSDGRTGQAAQHAPRRWSGTLLRQRHGMVL